MCGIILLAGLGEGLGLTLLLPILDFEQTAAASNSYTQAVYRFLEVTGMGVTLFSLLTLIVLAFLMKGVFMFLQLVITARITVNLIQSIRLSMFRKYMGMEYAYYTNSNIGYLNNVITTEVERAVHGFGKYTELLVSSIYILIYLVIASTINWRITVLVSILAIVTFTAFKALSRITRYLSVMVSEKNAQIQALLLQTIYYFKYLKATQSFAQLYKQFKERVSQHRSYQFKGGIISSIPAVVVEPLAVLLLAGLILYHTGVKGGGIAEILVLLIFFYRTFTRVFGFHIAWQKFWATIGGVEVLEHIEPELEAHQEHQGSRQVSTFKQAITFTNVNFRHGNQPVLADVNLAVAKNKTVGIVGASGAGKTTLFDLIMGLFRPDSGAVSIDGLDYHELDKNALRNMIGYVTQEPVVFNDTIANNISLWQGDMNDPKVRERIVRAAKLANCVEFIEQTDHGYDTLLGDKGIKLSGGQRQRIGIARELFKDVEILIFDEATSSLDSESERLIQESISAMLGTRTMVIAAHRLSTLKVCDYLYVLHEGRLVEEGSFRELYYNRDSRFARMCKAQNIEA